MSIPGPFIWESPPPGCQPEVRPFPFSICLNVNKFNVSLNILIETICPKIWAQLLTEKAKSPLLVVHVVHHSKMPLLKLSLFTIPTSLYGVSHFNEFTVLPSKISKWMHSHWGGGGGYCLWWPIRGGSARKGYLFQASGTCTWKGRDFTSWSI